MSVSQKVLHSTVVTAFAVLAALLPLASWGDEMFARPSDRDIKDLVKELDRQEKRFEKALDSKFKRSVLRGPGGEIDVDKYLDDLSEAIDRLGKRFTGDYSASTEATEVLQRASFMNSYIRENPSLKGANEWDLFGSNLQRLAAAYGTSFPLPGDAVVRRVGDGELEGAATAISKFSRDFSKVLKKSTRGMDALEDAVEQGEAHLKTVGDVGKKLASRIRSGKPASAEARQLLAAVEQVQAVVDTAGMPEDVVSAWEKGGAPISKIEQAFEQAFEL